MDAGSAAASTPFAVDSGVMEVDSLASASGPWLLLAAVLGAVTLYVRRRRMARRTAAARRFDTVARPSSGLLRRWGQRLSAGQRPQRGMRPMSPVAKATARPGAASRPRHMTNP
jgi:hypothetical protein